MGADVDLKLRISNFWNGGWVALGVWLGRRFKKTIYIYLAVLFTIFAIADTTVFRFTEKMRLGAFDAILHYRIIKPKPDPDIVILDINEASLDSMAQEFGRWPWPRQIFGEFIELIEEQKPKAIVFDILFSDPDLYNPESDEYFNSAIANASNTFFPMLRLDPSNDKLSQLKASMIPGVKAGNGKVKKDATIAMVLPHFQAALTARHLGLHNIYPDDDAIVRQYNLYSNAYGWKIPSLPATVGRSFGWPLPDSKSVLLNWRGAPFTYKFVSFAEVFKDLTRKNKLRPKDEFKGKILIVGSTAPSLFDVKMTPMSQMHPGVEILATAIDNFKHDDFLRFPQAQVLYLLLALAIVWVTAIGFYKSVDPIILDWWFGFSQCFLVSVSYASINFSNVYINLTGPVSLALAYFSITRTYATLTKKALESSMVRVSMGKTGKAQATLLLIRIDTHEISEIGWENIRVGLLKSGKLEKSVEVMRHDEKGLWSLFEKTLAVCWIAPIEDCTATVEIMEDAEIAIAIFPELMRKELIKVEGAASWFVHHGQISCGEDAEESWRLLFAEALIQWHSSNKRKAKK